MQFCDYILRQIDSLKKFIPFLLLLKGRGMGPSHYAMINKMYHVSINMKTTNFRWLSTQDLHIGAKLEYTRQISDLATKEYAIKITLD